MGRSRSDADDILTAIPLATMNIYDYTTPKSGETLTTLLSHKNVKINHIVSSDTLDKKEYVQEEDEWLVVIEGEAALLIENKTRRLLKGDTFFIPARTAHQIVHTQKGTVWLTVHIY